MLIPEAPRGSPDFLIGLLVVVPHCSLPYSHSLTPPLPRSLYFSSVLYPRVLGFFFLDSLQMSVLETGGLSVTHSSQRTGCPDLRLLHYNDVYHVEYAP